MKTQHEGFVIGLSIAVLALIPIAQGADCTVSNIKIKSMRAGYTNPCGSPACYRMTGVAVITNTCEESVGVEMQIVGLDKSGAPVAAKELWPASVRNIPPGEYTFSLDHWLEYDKTIKSFTLEVVRIKRWH